ncbi:MAG: glycosyltransferase family 4 protein [Lachnospiraceae bacterium]|nr:glycosyltransferase family 4 protein [Lachnospiraceae bacterium]
MKVLWLTNIMLPFIAEKLNEEASNKEGWLSGLCASVCSNPGSGIELAIAFPFTDSIRFTATCNQKEVLCYGFNEDITTPDVYDKTLENSMRSILNDYNPDIIHCFGTEYPHTLAMCKVAEDPGKLLIGIQGICTACAEEYLSDLPKDVYESVTLRDQVRKDSILMQKEKFAKRGEHEVEALKIAKNITGRTPFDNRFVREVNPEARYFIMNETLRPAFYEGLRWNETETEPHSIFMSQSDYPIKGLHYAILALAKIKQKYPDAKIYVAGQDIRDVSDMKMQIKISAYGKYLNKLLTANNLEDSVVFLGKLSEKEMRDAFLRYSLFLCCSSMENSPNSLGEAMILGMPCVAPGVGGIPGLLKSNQEGILFVGHKKTENIINNDSDETAEKPSKKREEAPAINELERIAGVIEKAVDYMWSNDDFRRAVSHNARIRAKKTHDPQTNFMKLQEIYSRILKAPKMNENSENTPEVVFVSNFINHHQIPFCENMYKLLGGRFVFVQMEEMDDERREMGWKEENNLPYLLKANSYEDVKKLLLDAPVVIFGGIDEKIMAERLYSGGFTFIYSERIYKEGKWKFVSPQGLKKKYEDHIKHRNNSAYLLCAGGYVAGDFEMIGAYPGKKYCFGYFPEVIHYNLDTLFAQKGLGINGVVNILWAGRMVDWKHPEYAVECARLLVEKGLDFHMDIIGNGSEYDNVRNLVNKYDLVDKVSLLGSKNPDTVRRYMEKADIFIHTSDRNEGWGAVINEAMNSGCAVVAGHMSGAVPYLIDHKSNGLVFKNKDVNSLYKNVASLILSPWLCRQIGTNAYYTIAMRWNASYASLSLIDLIGKLEGGLVLNVDEEVKKDMENKLDAMKLQAQGPMFSMCKLSPCVQAPILHETLAYMNQTEG